MTSCFAESDLLPISALQHLIYCPRQCALIHNERLWAENRLTVEGHHLHEKAHDIKAGETRPGVRITRGLPLRSLSLGITGVADVVEFHRQTGPNGDGVSASKTSESKGSQRVIPIEYKRGRPKKHDADRVQLCAQALCLEEMLNLSQEGVVEGRLFYGQTRHRLDVHFDESLRIRTRDVIAELHRLLNAGVTPPAAYHKSKCDRCSLIELCMPEQFRPRRTAAHVFREQLNVALAEI